MIPEPTPSLVINYYYLWQHEAKKGQESGVKDRPCVIVSAEPNINARGTNVIIAPITHTKPDLNMAVEIPPKVMQHLGLDEKPSYIICTEVNTFTWPGFDLQPLGSDSAGLIYGYIPPRLFSEVKEKILQYKMGSTLRIVSRND